MQHRNGDGNGGPDGDDARLRYLASRRDIAWSPGTDGSHVWFYRPGELVVAADALDEVRKTLRSMKVRVRGPVEVAPGGATVLLVATRAGVPELVDELERRLGNRSGVVGPNHVLLAAPQVSWGPGTEPEPVEELSWAAEGDAGRCVRVAVVDTGLLKTHAAHPFLQSGILADVDDIEDPDIDGNGFVDVVAGHGTFVAGVVRRVAPGATVIVEKALNDGGYTDEVDLGRQLVQALRGFPDIVNLSVGGHTRNGAAPIALQALWEQVERRRPEIVVVAAAGNQGSDKPFWPAASKHALGVGAVDDNGDQADFSNFGVNADLWAPGVDVDNAYCDGTYRPLDGSGDRSFKGFARWSGTSFAAPYVAGAIAARMTADGVSAGEARDRVVSDAAASPGSAGPTVRV